MLLDDFVNKYKGKKVDFDGVYGVQCVDLFRQYAKECLGIVEHTGSCTTTGGAKDLFLDYNKMPIEKKYFSRITNKSYIPGDVAIWDSTEKNKYGHVFDYAQITNTSDLYYQLIEHNNEYIYHTYKKIPIDVARPNKL